ncbi:hypothetical protein BS50DRAFT_603658 [Corynespora cassiicola Philippines]|uniref:AA9 family lytic polysaccharide monooxygenase n=1 Tax=Corynespora cassiicola Philippines TaxID=1448308 RepID=A0A2T2N9Q8_CORCC|nr:hypothetical protein BS50DRAFT_603658 [Corynespora cassiicola Philippines]
MKTRSLTLAALAAVPSAFAHTVFTNFYIDGVSQGDGVAVRMPLDPKTASAPIASLDSNDMACNVDGSKGVSRVQTVPDGATLTFEIRSWPDDPSKERLERGHKGPCALYLKKVASAVEDQAHGDGWFKLFADGYDGSNWCTDKIIDNNGLLSVKLPEGLEGGYYLARPEILALHAANSGDPQFYTGCAQIYLESTGNLVPESTVSIPGYVKYGQPATSFDIYNTDNSEYTLPGPEVAKLTAGGASLASIASASEIEGARPEGCIDENANWCGKEVSSYSDETGCWAASEECWTQLDACYDSAPPTGNAGCKIWEKKCNGLSDQCKAGNFQGPPSKGEDLTPKAVTIDLGNVNKYVGDVDETPKTSAEQPKTSATPKATSATPSAAAAKATDAYAEEAPAPVETPVETPKYTITVPASENAPAPTAPASYHGSKDEPEEECPEGYDCVTIYTTEIKTEVVYHTVYADKKRRTLHQRRHHGHWF